MRRRIAEEVCELCSSPLGPGHRHLVAIKERKIICACDPCAVLFDNQAQRGYKRIGNHVRRLSDFQMSDAQWDRLMIPINLAFFFHDSLAGKVIAVYPSPAGAVESLLDLDSWNQIESENPALKEMRPDVEAALVNRVSGAREVFVVPIDVCYKLVGLIRSHWRGLSGGSEVWRQVESLFAELTESSKTPVRQR